jgi:tRNA (cytidine/uridine-2'-O-)-methyltransferase
LFTKKARRNYSESRYSDGDYLVLGKESTGIPDEILVALPESCERIPMLPDAASLKNADTWAARGPSHDHSSLKRQDICGNFIDFENYHISSLNLSNAANIVLYEALRQNGFPGMDVVGNKK